MRSLQPLAADPRNRPRTQPSTSAEDPVAGNHAGGDVVVDVAVEQPDSASSGTMSATIMLAGRRSRRPSACRPTVYCRCRASAGCADRPRCPCSSRTSGRACPRFMVIIGWFPKTYPLMECIRFDFFELFIRLVTGLMVRARTFPHSLSSKQRTSFSSITEYSTKRSYRRPWGSRPERAMPRGDHHRPHQTGVGVGDLVGVRVVHPHQRWSRRSALARPVRVPARGRCGCRRWGTASSVCRRRWCRRRTGRPRCLLV